MSPQRSPSGRRVLAATVLALMVMSGCGDGGGTDGSDRPVRWVLTAEPDGRTIPVRAEFGGSSCTDFDEWLVEETDTEVEVLAIVTFSGAGDCTADLVIESHALRLDGPLGDRRLVGCDPEDDEAACTETVAP